ncbi:MAG: zf-HC2 domain-containing protein [Planctomycetaceae bacterium]|nr:zf-HC2 domain-containing protein [Planctomycetaceae bacterium]
MNVTACPDLETLELLLLGKLPFEQREQLEAHLMNCQSCASTASTVAATDALTDALRTARPINGDEDILFEVIERGKQLRSLVETGQSEATIITGNQIPMPSSKIR